MGGCASRPHKFDRAAKVPSDTPNVPEATTAAAAAANAAAPAADVEVTPPAAVVEAIAKQTPAERMEEKKAEAEGVAVVGVPTGDLPAEADQETEIVVDVIQVKVEQGSELSKVEEIEVKVKAVAPPALATGEKGSEEVVKVEAKPSEK